MPMLLAVIGSVSGTLVTSAFGSSPNLTLIGATVGAAVPPLVAVAGPGPHLRLGVGVLVAVLALIVTYGGFTVRDKVQGTPGATFPNPQGQTTAPKTEVPTTSPPGMTCEGQLCIEWSPRQLFCTNDPCEPGVTVINAGTKRLRITSLEFRGAAGGRLSQEGTCKGASLNKEATCSIRVHVKPGAAGHAQLLIHQNLKGPASFVEVEVDAMPPISTSGQTSNVDLSLSTLPECYVIPGGALSGADNLTIFVRILNSGPDQLPSLVPFSITSDTGLSGRGNSGVSDGSSFTAMQVDLLPDAYERSHRFTVTADPANDIAERDESNNTLNVTVTLPAQPSQQQVVECTAP